MKEILAIVRMKKTGATKKALISAGVAGFTAIRVLGRGRKVEDNEVIMPCKTRLMEMAVDDVLDLHDTEEEITTFLDGTRLFPRRLFTILVHDEDVPRVIEGIMIANKTDRGVGDGVIFVLPVLDAIRIRTGETGEAAIW
ncbi:MAG: P-II family nitrogen regulator [Methanocalculus sp.]|uniref:P-II family nitrogen regulator n=1 Tax=Methanocalculus sp. TaxID=2004547 RepID=UPI0027217DE7|nr:P-II family nitrogen regulator [Methanocalculus sp.]MDO8841211.1 P-II family nitrogen regulator [Methanocalculus sp.]MDO9539927.1 P-II family nitrogen regulator [Methanocalculus sp.]